MTCRATALKSAYRTIVSDEIASGNKRGVSPWNCPAVRCSENAGGSRRICENVNVLRACRTPRKFRRRGRMSQTVSRFAGSRTSDPRRVRITDCWLTAATLSATSARIQRQWWINVRALWSSCRATFTSVVSTNVSSHGASLLSACYPAYTPCLKKASRLFSIISARIFRFW